MRGQALCWNDNPENVSLDDSSDAPRRMAVLVDADNIPYDSLTSVLEEAGKHGDAQIRRAYGDWGQQDLQNWRTAALDHGFKTIHQERVKGKGSTDAALIIDAMQLLFETDVAGYCIVSSDGDYRRLMLTLRERGKLVIGIGEEKTPKHAMNAATEFVTLSNITPPKVTKESPAVKPKPKRLSKELREALIRSVDSAAGEDGWARISAIGTRIRNVDAGFDVRTYGFKRLTDLLKSRNTVFEVGAPEGVDEASSQSYVRLKETNP